MSGKNKIRQKIFVAKDSHKDVDPYKDFIIHFRQGTTKQIKGGH